MLKSRRNLAVMLANARAKPEARPGVAEELCRVAQKIPGNNGLAATRALIELLLDGTLGLPFMPLLQKVGEEKVRNALADGLGNELHLHVHRTGKGNDAADNLALWFCGWGLPFESLDIAEPTLESRPATT